jgi:hypothetical protein
MRIYSISLLFVVQVWNIKFYQCIELVQITPPVIEITHYNQCLYLYRYHPSGATVLMSKTPVYCLIQGSSLY